MLENKEPVQSQPELIDSQGFQYQVLDLEGQACAGCALEWLDFLPSQGQQ